MSESFDKEINSLLRRLSGAAAGPRPRGNGAPASSADAHLDADELSAFAEGSLPTAARVAASTHLADCDECRGLVVNLARAAGVEGEIEKHVAAAPVLAGSSQPSRLRAWLAALFAPGALRYVAPVLALSLIAAISFVALRSRRAEERLAQSRGSAAPRGGITDDQTVDTNGALPSSVTTANANANIATTSSATNNAASHGVASTNTAAADQPAKESPASGASSSEAAAGKSDTAAAPPSPPKDAPAAAPAERKTATDNEPVEVTSAEDKPKAAQTAETEAGQASAGQPQQNQRNLSRNEVQQQSPDGSRNQTRSSVNGTQNNAAGAGGFIAGNRGEDRDKSGAATSAPAARRRPSDDKRAKSEESRAAGNDEVARNGETRSVAGHSFRREGGAWVDVNYKSSMSSTGVRRGTDSYRALAADIPELGRIAEQLNGEVIVVVRGRAYRIR